MKKVSPGRTLARHVLFVLVALGAVPLLPSASQAQQAEPPVIDAPRFREVGRVRVEDGVGRPGPDNSASGELSGWLVLDPATRRGYTLTEVTHPFTFSYHVGTLIESFDLDTLRPLRRAIVPGFPVGTGSGDYLGQGLATTSAEVAHAVDPGAGRLYLAWNSSIPMPFLGSYNQRRATDYFLVLDEEAFDRDPTRAFGAFRYPVGQEHLNRYYLMGMAVSRAHVAPGRPGKLLAAFASPSPYATPTVGDLTVPVPLVYDHTLVQWDPAGVATGGAAPLVPAGTAPLVAPVAGDWALVLAPCATATMTTTPTGDGEYAAINQWAVLPRRDAVYLGCQSAPGSGAVLRVPLDPRTGGLGIEPMRLFPLGKKLGDVLADEGGGRLLLRTFGGGHTWWVFDVAEQRYTGSIATSVNDGRLTSAGVDPATGRFYTLGPDDCALRAGGTGSEGVPVRGGLRVADTRLDPVPAADHVLAELAYPARYRIRVDPVRRRVFVRRGSPYGYVTFPYPHCGGAANQVRTPQEPFYRVYEDRVPLAEQPGDLDDSAFTTDVDEAEGLTQASYLGSGSGYGSRSLLIGGIDALTRGAPTDAKSLCGRDDREALAGSVGKVEVSDQSTVAEAAALDADARTQDALGDPVSRCRPQAPHQPVGSRNLNELNRCHGDLDVREGAFDQAEPGEDRNGDGCTDRDRENRYAARCLGSRNAASPGFDDRRVAPRDGFEATVQCKEREERASASSTASGASDAAEEARRRAVDSAGSPGEPVRVARSSSTVSVARKAGRGVTVKVDSTARGVEIPGAGTVGVVRAEATSTATGRDRGATTTFRRTICDVDVQGFVVSGCLGDEAQQRAFVEHLNRALGGRGEARLRSPDPTLAEGSAHGYLAGVQRDGKELFADQMITKDRSLAVPALEIVLYQGDGGKWGVGRQVFQLAGVQATTSYGIACLNGRRADGSCAAAGETAVPPEALDDDPGPGTDDGGLVIVTETLADDDGAPAGGGGLGGVVTRMLRAVPRALAEALRLLFNDPRELGLLSALWALLYAPCYLGDRRRAVREVAARRLTAAAG